jgi:cAMP-specific phosphodiesterase 4
MAEENPELTELLEELGEWNFDTIQFNHASLKYPIIEMGAYVFSTLGLVDRFTISHLKLTKFLTAAETYYRRDIYYHNNIHAADVLNSVLFLLNHGLYSSGRLSDVDILSLAIASITHDIGHIGVNNAFLVATGGKLAQKYHD